MNKDSPFLYLVCYLVLIRVIVRIELLIVIVLIVLIRVIVLIGLLALPVLPQRGSEERSDLGLTPTHTHTMNQEILSKLREAKALSQKDFLERQKKRDLKKFLAAERQRQKRERDSRSGSTG